MHSQHLGLSCPDSAFGIRPISLLQHAAICAALWSSDPFLEPQCIDIMCMG